MFRKISIIQNLVVIGAGMASGRAIERLLDQHPDLYHVTLFGSEPRGNYNRIMINPADIVVMAVGIRPETRLATDAHLKVGRGIVVNDQMVTSDPDILAVGECVEHNKQLFGLVAPLYDQAKVVAKRHAAAFQPVQTATQLKVIGCDLFSAGDFADSRWTIPTTRNRGL